MEGNGSAAQQFIASAAGVAVRIAGAAIDAAREAALAGGEVSAGYDAPAAEEADASNASSTATACVAATAAVVATTWKRKLPRKSRKHSKRKKSNYNFDEARQSLGLDPTATFSQIRKVAQPTEPLPLPPSPELSPTKSEVKMERDELKATVKVLQSENEALQKQNDLATAKAASQKEIAKKLRVTSRERQDASRRELMAERAKTREVRAVADTLSKSQDKHIRQQQKKIASLQKGSSAAEARIASLEVQAVGLKQRARDLADQLRREKEASHLVVHQLMTKVEEAADEAHSILVEATENKRRLEQRMEDEKLKMESQHKEAIKEERRWSARQQDRMSKKMDSQICKIESEYQAILRVKDRRLEALKKELLSQQEKLDVVSSQWQEKLQQCRLDMDKANDRAFSEKRKRWHIVNTQVQKAKRKRRQMQNYIDCLRDTNSRMAIEWKAAMEQKKAAETKSSKAQLLAQQRLDK